MKISVIRHGTSNANVNHILDGWVDTKLSDVGKEELERYRKEFDYFETDGYYCSTLSRCRDTLHALYPSAKNVIYLDDLREAFYGEYEDATEDVIDFSLFFHNWVDCIKMNTEEPYPIFKERVKNVFDYIINDAKYRGFDSVTIVTHGGVVKVLYLLLNELEDKEYHNVIAKHGKGFLFEIDDNKKLIRQERIGTI